MIKGGYHFSLIGPGRVGSSLALALEAIGWRANSFLVKEEHSASVNALKVHFPFANITSDVTLLVYLSDVVLITVQDDEIAGMVKSLAKNPNIRWKSKVVLHMSGIVNLRVLRPLKKLGASVGALHPVAAFANEFNPVSAREIWYDFFGERPAQIVARRIVSALDSRFVVLRSENQRTILHLAASIASNSTAVAISAAEGMLKGLLKHKDAKELMQSLLFSTVRNLSENEGIRSLTGPLVRGDTEVIGRHLKALENNPTLSQFYKSWSLLGVDLLLKNGNNETRLRKIKEMLEKN